MADVDAQQVLDLLRGSRQVPRPRHERRRRSGDGVADLDVATLQRRGAEIHQRRQQLLLFDAGYSFNYEEYVITNQDGVNQAPFSREWYAGASRRDQTLVTLRNGLANWGGRYPDRFNTQASVSYVTGSHNAKIGFQYNWGTYINTREANADLQQVYTNGVPSSVTIYNTPLRYKDALLGDLGIYAQDTWTINRLTLNGGIRFETLKHEVSKQSSGIGRFIGERNFDPIPMPTWKDLAPRFGVVYDLFGNAKTALKFGLNRYNESRTTFFANRYNPLALSSASLSWTDVNGDDIAQGELGCTYLTPGCEINLAQLPATFGRAQLNRVDPDFKRVYNIETTAGVQHELLPRVSLSANWYRRTFHRLRVTDNMLRTMSDYIPFDIFNPMTGEPLQHLRRLAGRGQPRRQSRPNAGDERKHVYTGFDLTLQARLAARRHAVRRLRDRAEPAQHLRRAGRSRTCCSTATTGRTTSRSARR